uniref:Granulins-like n=1 Tax=Phallusia mammillata TaxID=59560 RepID=A0A6F9DE05_9ASCI|nr:granulins-like [Phallusia mammillata]
MFSSICGVTSFILLNIIVSECFVLENDKSTNTDNVLSLTINLDVTSVVCPGGTSMCPDGNTCCKLPSGQYGCCPVPNAVCCSDGVHCCPNGYTCNVGAGTCIKMSTISQISMMFADNDIGHQKSCMLSDKCTMCKDGSECPSYYTCCLLSDGRYGCCQYSKAVCCSDHLHCCPQFSYCDLKKQVCRSQYGEHVLAQMLPSQKATRRDEIVGKKIVFTAEETFAVDDGTL